MLKQLLLFALIGLLYLSPTARADIQVTDSLGTHTLPTAPQRVAVLNWDLVEQVLELDTVPIAIPEISEYREWVVRPTIPDSVADLGERIEPNLEKLARLKPDLILIASPQLDIKPKLETIAPVLFYHTYSTEHENAEAAVQTFRQLAALFGKETLAENKLARQNARIAELGRQVQAAWHNQVPEVTTLRFASPTSIYAYGDNAISQYVLKKMGIEPALHFPTTQWGVTQTRLTTLKDIKEGIVLYFEPFDQEQKLKQSPLWQAMPFVQRNRVNSIAPVWTYGGAMSLGYMAEALAQSLLEISPQP